MIEAKKVATKSLSGHDKTWNNSEKARQTRASKNNGAWHPKMFH